MCLTNDALNTFYLRLFVRHMEKDHSDSEKGNPLPLHGLLFPISSKGSFICMIPTDRTTHTSAYITPVVEHCKTHSDNENENPLPHVKNYTINIFKTQEDTNGVEV